MHPVERLADVFLLPVEVVVALHQVVQSLGQVFVVAQDLRLDVDALVEAVRAGRPVPVAVLRGYLQLQAVVQLVFSSLLPRDALEQLFAALPEVLVLVLFLLRLLLFVLLPEAVHVQLSDERRVVAVVEVLWQYLVAEGVDVGDDQRVTALAPFDQLFVARVLRDLTVR